MRQRAAALAVLAMLLGIARSGVAGPPFLTDDPEPVDFGHYEFYLFSTVDIARDVVNAEWPAVEFNAGIAPNLQFHVVLPMAWSAPEGGPTMFGPGDTELGLKYRFIQESDWFPMVGTFPMLELPTGDEDRGLGNGRTWERLPIWMQKSWGPWTSYGGGGYAINPEPGARDYWFGGWQVQRDLGEKLTLGAELFAQGPTMAGEDTTVFFNVGGSINFTRQFNLLFLAGHDIVGEQHFIAYLGLYWTWPEPAEKQPD